MGSNENHANVHIWNINGTDAQKFILVRNDRNGFAILTKVSNFQKAVVLAGPTYETGGNINQYNFQNYINEIWIMEPVVPNSQLGYEYAIRNYNHNNFAYPSFERMGGNCANFVSQCLVAEGIHYRDSWYMYRKGNDQIVNNFNHLMSNWEFGGTNKWFSAVAFEEFWHRGRGVNSYVRSVDSIIQNPSSSLNMSIGIGDVIQVLRTTSNGGIGAAEHTMFVTGFGNSTFNVTYRSYDTINNNLLEVCRRNRGKYLRFYNFVD